MYGILNELNPHKKTSPPIFTHKTEVRVKEKKNTRSEKANWQCIEKYHFGTNRFAYQFYIKAKLIYRNETRPYNICVSVMCVCMSVGMIFFIEIKWFASSSSSSSSLSKDENGWLLVWKARSETWEKFMAINRWCHDDTSKKWERNI